MDTYIYSFLVKWRIFPNCCSCSWRDRRVLGHIYVVGNVFKGCEPPQSLCERRGEQPVRHLGCIWVWEWLHILQDWSLLEMPRGRLSAAGRDSLMEMASLPHPVAQGSHQQLLMKGQILSMSLGRLWLWKQMGFPFHFYLMLEVRLWILPLWRSADLCGCGPGQLSTSAIGIMKHSKSCRGWHLKVQLGKAPPWGLALLHSHALTKLSCGRGAVAAEFPRGDVEDLALRLRCISSVCFILNKAISIRRSAWCFWFSLWSPSNLVSNPSAAVMKFSVVYIVIKTPFGEYHFDPHYMPNIGINYSLCNGN